MVAPERQPASASRCPALELVRREAARHFAPELVSVQIQRDGVVPAGGIVTFGGTAIAGGALAAGVTGAFGGITTTLGGRYIAATEAGVTIRGAGAGGSVTGFGGTALGSAGADGACCFRLRYGRCRRWLSHGPRDRLFGCFFLLRELCAARLPDEKYARDRSWS